MRLIALLLALLAASLTHRDKGLAAVRAGNDDEAISQFTAAIRARPTARHPLAMGVRALRRYFAVRPTTLIWYMA